MFLLGGGVSPRRDFLGGKDFSGGGFSGGRRFLRGEPDFLFWPLKATGGYRVKNTCWIHIKELFNTSSALFTECKNSIPSSRYLRLSTAGYDGNRPFPYYFPIQKMG